MKAVEVTYRDESNESKGRAAKWSFALLLASLGFSLAVLGVNAATSNGVSDGKAGINTPTTSSASAP